MYLPPKSLDALKELSAPLSEEFERVFVSLHHFAANPPFNSKPTGFAEFVAYCEERVKGINPGQENERTIQRAYRFLELRHAGQSIEESKDLAWQEVPLVKTSGAP